MRESGDLRASCEKVMGGLSRGAVSVQKWSEAVNKLWFPICLVSRSLHFSVPVPSSPLPFASLSQLIRFQLSSFFFFCYLLSSSVSIKPAVPLFLPDFECSPYALKRKQEATALQETLSVCRSLYPLWRARANTVGVKLLPIPLTVLALWTQNIPSKTISSFIAPSYSLWKY